MKQLIFVLAVLFAPSVCLAEKTYLVGDTYWGVVASSGSNGAAQYAVCTPTACWVRAGTRDVTVPLTFAQLEAGVYSITSSIGANWGPPQENRISLYVTATATSSTGNVVGTEIHDSITVLSGSSLTSGTGVGQLNTSGGSVGTGAMSLSGYAMGASAATTFPAKWRTDGTGNAYLASGQQVDATKIGSRALTIPTGGNINLGVYIGNTAALNAVASDGGAILSGTTVVSMSGMTSAAAQTLVQTLIGKKTWYVAGGGNDANDGLSPATAKASLDSALSQVVGLEVINLGQGIWPVTLNVGNVIIQGAGRTTCSITGGIICSAAGTVMLKEVTFDSITFDGTYLAINNCVGIGESTLGGTIHCIDAVTLSIRDSEIDHGLVMDNCGYLDVATCYLPGIAEENYKYIAIGGILTHGGVIRDTIITASYDGTFTGIKHTQGGSLLLDSVAIALSGSTGNIVGILVGDGTAVDNKSLLFGGAGKVSTPSRTGCYDLVANKGTGGNVTLAIAPSVYYDPAKTSGDTTITNLGERAVTRGIDVITVTGATPNTLANMAKTTTGLIGRFPLVDVQGRVILTPTTSVTASTYSGSALNVTATNTVAVTLDATTTGNIAAIKVKTDLITAGSVRLTSPLSTIGTLTLNIGDDYLNADGRAITFTDSGTTWPAFTAGSCSITIKRKSDGSALFTKTGTVAAARTLRFDLTKTDTAKFVRAAMSYEVTGTTAGGSVISVAIGNCVAGN